MWAEVLRCFRSSGVLLKFWGLMVGDTEVLGVLVVLLKFWGYC